MPRTPNPPYKMSESPADCSRTSFWPDQLRFSQEELPFVENISRTPPGPATDPQDGPIHKTPNKYLWAEILEPRENTPETPKKYPKLRSQEKGFSKGGFCRIRRHAQENENTQGYWASQHIWHSERRGKERRRLLQKPPSKTPLFFCVAEKRAFFRYFGGIFSVFRGIWGATPFSSGFLKNGHFSVFRGYFFCIFRIFRGHVLGTQLGRVSFRHFSWKFWVVPCLGAL